MGKQLAVDGGPRPDGSVQLEISNAIVAVYKQRLGRGPTRVRTHWAGSDTLVCVLEDGFSQAELTLEAMGERERARDLRAVLNEAMRPDVVAAVERVLSRTVRARTAGTDQATGIATEVFHLEPREL